MEKHQEQNSGNNGISVDVAKKNHISVKKKDAKKSLDDKNCNVTKLRPKDDKVRDDIDLLQSCEHRLGELSLNGPSKLSNGIESPHFLKSDCSSTDNSNSKNSSSHCETCVKAVENPIENKSSDLDKHSLVQVPSEYSQSEDGTQNGPVNDSSVCIHNDPPIFHGVDVTLKDNSAHEVTPAFHSGDSNNQESTELIGCSSKDSSEHTDTTSEGIATSEQEECVNSEKHEGTVILRDIIYVSYESELQMPDIMRLIQKDLSEPYSIYTYRYFIHNWPQLCFLAMDEKTCVGAIVCKLDMHRKVVKRGYIAMLAVDEKYRKRKIGSNLVLKAIRAMVGDGADEVVLETEITNKPALRLYENLGFVRDKRLFRYYLNGVDALRLKLWLR